MPVSKKPRKGKSPFFRQVIRKTKIVKTAAGQFVVQPTSGTERTILHKRNII